jgi:hypothetical protein
MLVSLKTGSWQIRSRDCAVRRRAKCFNFAMATEKERERERKKGKEQKAEMHFGPSAMELVGSGRLVTDKKTSNAFRVQNDKKETRMDRREADAKNKSISCRSLISRK